MERKSSLVIGPRTRQNILEGKHVRKDPDGCDQFADYWTDSGDESSSTVSKNSDFSSELPEEVPNSHSSNIFKGSDVRNYRLRQRIDNSPLKSKAVHSPLKSKAVHSPLKSKEVSDSLNVNKGVNNNKKAFATESENITINLGVDDNNPKIGTLNRAVDNFVKNNLPSTLSKSSSGVIQEMSINNLSLSLTYKNNNEMPMLVSKVSFKTSKKSIPRSTKRHEKIKEQQLEFDEYDEKIMQMVRMKGDMGSEEDMSEQSTFMEKEKEMSETEKESVNVSKDVAEKENSLDSESQDTSLKRNTRSLNQSMNDSESVSFRNSYKEKIKSTPKRKDKENVNCLENDITYVKNKKTVSGTSQYKKIPSETFISKKKLSTENSHATGISMSPHEIESNITSESDIDTCETQTTTSVVSPKNANDIVNDSSSKVIRSQKRNENVLERNNLVDQHPSKTAMPENSLPGSPMYMLANESSFSDNYLNTPAISPEKTNGFVNDSSSEVIENEERNKNVSEKNYSVDQHSSKTAMSENSCKPNSFLEKSKLHKNDSLCRSVTAVGINTSKNENKDSFCDNSAIDSTSDPCMIRKQKTINKKRGFISESILDATGTNGTFRQRTTKRRKTLANKQSTVIPEENDIVKNIPDDTIEKTTKKQEKIKTLKNKQKAISHEENDLMPDKHVVQSVDLDNLSQLAKNSSITKENYYADISLNSPEISKNSVTRVHIKKASGKQGKAKNDKNRQKTVTNNKSDLVLDKVNTDTADLDNLPPLHTPKRKSSRNSSITEKNNQKKISLKSSMNFLKIKNTSKNQRKKNDESNSRVRKTATDKSGSFMLFEENIPETTCLNESSVQQNTKKRRISINSSEKSVKKVSEVSRKKATKEKSRNKNDKNRQICDENDIENQNLSKARKSEKSNSNLSKSNLNKENENSNEPIVRRSSRQKFAPLARWRNERLLYRFENGNIETIGVDHGTKEDTAFLLALNKDRVKRKIEKPKKAAVLDVKKNKKKLVHLHKKFPLVVWDSPVRCKTDENVKNAFLIKRMIETKKNSFGYVHIDAGKTKPPQYMPEEDILLIVMDGNLEVMIQDNSFILENKDMFIVPSGSAYSITNIGKKRALISYVVGKFNFLEDL